MTRRAASNSGMIDIIVAIEAGDWPPRDELEALAARAVAESLVWLEMVPAVPSELGLTFTDDAGMAAANGKWRGKPAPTNVLSFPLVALRPGDALPPLLGDIIVAEQTVRREARQQRKPFLDHLTHLVVHGFLHLAGYDHVDDAEAETMEAAERGILQRLAIPDPYA